MKKPKKAIREVYQWACSKQKAYEVTGKLKEFFEMEDLIHDIQRCCPTEVKEVVEELLQSPEKTGGPF